MTTSQLLALELGAAVVAAGSWAGTAVLAAMAPSRRTARFAVALTGLGVVALIAQVALTAVLLPRHWAFVQERVVFALPLAVAGAGIAVAVAGRPLLAAARGWPDRLPPIVPTGLTGACIAGVTGIVARSVVGYPLTLPAAGTLLALALLAAALASALFARRGRRRIVALAAFGALVAASAVGYAWLTDIADPSALSAPHRHAPAVSPDAPAAGAVSVEDLRTPAGSGPVASFELTASTERLTLASGSTVDAWTYGSLPGPELRVSQGDLVEVTLTNHDIDAGVTIHWHGVDLPNGDDGVAGVTQNAVMPGDSFVYRFVAEDPGTYWYHTHQHSAEGVKRGLYGALIVVPRDGIDEEVDLTVPVHTLGRRVLLGESDTVEIIRVAAGKTVRLRLLNTDQVPRRFRIAGTPFRVVAADARDVAGGEPVDSAALRIPAGGRIDVAFPMPATGVLLTTDATSRASLTLSADGAATALEADATAPDLDLLSYGRPDALRSQTPDGPLIRSTMVLDRLPRFLNGLPRESYTVNGLVFPHIPSIDVREGDTLDLTVVNRGWETHPMHIHGHHVLVLSRNGEAATGAPLLLDTFDVQPGEVWEVRLVADNPGIWMDHCHNLDHAVEGMTMALRYEGVTSPFRLGGSHDNHPE